MKFYPALMTLGISILVISAIGIWPFIIGVVALGIMSDWRT